MFTNHTMFTLLKDIKRIPKKEEQFTTIDEVLHNNNFEDSYNISCILL